VDKTAAKVVSLGIITASITITSAVYMNTETTQRENVLKYIEEEYTGLYGDKK